MDDLTAFVSARLDEDEAAAKAAGGDEWATDTGDVVSAALARGDYGPHGYWVAAASFACESEWESLHEGHAAHIARHDPARVLREVAAKRAILVEHRDTWNDYKDGDGIERTSHECRTCEPSGSPDDWPCPTIRAVAAVWSDHPDYKREWAPLT